MTGHTPTPWASVDGILGPCDEGHERSFVRPVKSDGYQIAQTVGPNGPANAAHIVSCVNSHAALVEALKAAIKRTQLFLDTFDDLGDCETQADINDWHTALSRCDDPASPHPGTAK